MFGEAAVFGKGQFPKRNSVVTRQQLLVLAAGKWVPPPRRAPHAGAAIILLPRVYNSRCQTWPYVFAFSQSSSYRAGVLSPFDRGRVTWGRSEDSYVVVDHIQNLVTLNVVERTLDCFVFLLFNPLPC